MAKRRIEKDSEEFPDSNGDGIPDAFENRAPIAEILNNDSPVRQTTSKVEQVIADVPSISELKAEHQRLRSAVTDALMALEAFERQHGRPK